MRTLSKGKLPLVQRSGPKTSQPEDLKTETNLTALVYVYEVREHRKRAGVPLVRGRSRGEAQLGKIGVKPRASEKTLGF